MTGCGTCGAVSNCPLKVQVANQIESKPRGQVTSVDGIFNVNKPAGMTSHDVVSVVRGFSRLQRVGHAGTLDPMATGVLLVCLGQATRVVEYLSDHDKKYRARVRLGVETDTYDATGTVVAERTVGATREQIETALRDFVGKLSQMPPAYSAIKQQGVPLYKLARQGKPVETEPRAVEIFSIGLVDVALPEIEFDVHCSKGTYIRSLAHDLGEKLGCGAHLTALTRTASGQFTLGEAHTLDELHAAFEDGYAERFLIPIDEALLQFEAIMLDPAMAKRIQQGNALTCARDYSSSFLRAYSANGDLIALLERGSAQDEWKPKKVFLYGNHS
jgi:tRNA pseudouridine55 synthase